MSDVKVVHPRHLGMEITPNPFPGLWELEIGYHSVYQQDSSTKMAANMEL